jgi:hypothetical protein
MRNNNIAVPIISRDLGCVIDESDDGKNIYVLHIVYIAVIWLHSVVRDITHYHTVFKNAELQLGQKYTSWIYH